MDWQEDELNDIMNMFRQEGEELLHSIGNSLSILDNDFQNTEAILQLSRDLHSLKGSSRMLGFVNLQNLAHKMEDVVFLAKEKKIVLKSNVVDELFNIVDYFHILINKTAENKQEYFTSELEEHIKTLSEFEQQEQEENSKEKLLKHLHSIEAYLIEAILLSLKYESDSDFTNIEELQNKLCEIEKCFSEINFQGVEKEISNLLNALKNFNSKEKNDISNIKNGLDNIVLKFKEFCQTKSIETSDYKELAQKQLTEINSHQDFIQNEEIKVQKIKADIDNEILNLLKDIEEKFESEPIDKNALQKELEEIIERIDYGEFKKIFKIILKLVKNQIENNLNDESVFRSLKHIVLDAIEIYQNPDSELQDYELLTQRASIVEQISFVNSSAKTQKSKPKESNWVNMLDSGAIKTLRVDSLMLDNLGSQIGDLITIRIKNSKHLLIAKQFQNALEDWQKQWHKVGYYIKYFDRKYLSTEYEHQFDMQTIVSYNKQLISLYLIHSEQIANLISSFAELNKKLQENDSKLNSVSNLLENTIKKLRILPLATIFHLLPRMVHNLSLDQNKKIDFKIEGSEVSVDKKIIEDIKMPIIHILRNSIDHGIETQAERLKNGKSEIGKITVSAKHIENKIVIKISDDGQGINIEKVKNKIVKLKLAPQSAVDLMKDDEIIEYIFTPGFTTENKVTDISGRGLGLNIVNTTIKQLNGKINVISNRGYGTDIIIEIPIGMATINALVVSEQNELYAMPTSSIKTVLRLSPDEIFKKDNKNYFIHKNEMLQIFTLSEILGYEPNIKIANKLTVLLLEVKEKTVGIIIDKLIGDQEIIHKKLSLPLCHVKNISGITTLADGETCLVLNASDIIKTISKSTNSLAITTSNENIEIENNKKYTIVLVDDSITTRTLEKNILKRKGYRVIECSNGEEMLEDIKNKKIDLIITDYEMPGLKGSELNSALKENEKTSKIPIVLLTSYQSITRESDYSEYNFDKILYKNEFSENYFLETIKDILEEEK